MIKLTIALLALSTVPALAEKPDARPNGHKACTFVVAVDRDSWEEIYWHENAHCWEWTHPERAAPRPGENYQAPKPSAIYRLWLYPGATVISATTTDAMKLCDGHWGCQWFGEQP